MCREREEGTAKETPKQKPVTKPATPEVSYKTALTAGAPPWFCQECGETVRNQLTKCPVKGCVGKKPTPPPQEPELLLLSKPMRTRVKGEPPAGEDGEGSVKAREQGEEEVPRELQKLLNIESSYTDNDSNPPQDLIDKIAAFRKKHFQVDPTPEEKVTKMETLRDAQSERIRLMKKEAVDMLKAKGELEAAEEAVKRGTEMRASKIKETEAAYRLQLDAIKVDFDAGDLVKKAKVEAARQKIHDLEENHRKALERVDQWESKTTMDTNKDDGGVHIGVDAAERSWRGKT